LAVPPAHQSQASGNERPERIPLNCVAEIRPQTAKSPASVALNVISNRAVVDPHHIDMSMAQVISAFVGSDPRDHDRQSRHRAGDSILARGTAFYDHT
jgi:hypothetical protein